jgi:hypothetical protein
MQNFKKSGYKITRFIACQHIRLKTPSLLLILYFIILCFCSTARADGMRALHLKDFSQDISLENHLYLYKDESKKIQINTLLQKPQLFILISPYELQLGYKQINAWLKFKIQYSGTAPNEYFFIIQNAGINDISFFIYNSDGKPVKCINTGMDYPFYKREINSRFFVFKIPMKPNNDYTVYAKLHNRIGNLSTPVQLMDLIRYQRFSKIDEYTETLFFALMFLSFSVAFILMVIFREAIYTYYFTYLFFLTFHFFSVEGLSFQYFFPNNSELANLSRGLLIIPTLVSFLLFFIKLISHPYFSPLWILKILRIQIGVYALLFCAIFIPKPDYLTQLTVVITHYNTFICLALVAWVLVKGIKDRFRPSYYLSMAIFPNLALGFISLLRNFGFIHTNHSVMMYGVTLEIIFLFAALMSRFKIQILKNYTLNKKVNHYQSLIGYIQQKNNTESPTVLQKLISRSSTAKFSVSDIENNYTILKELIIQKKIYLNRDLSLNNLASELNISIHLLSHIINQK